MQLTWLCLYCRVGQDAGVGVFANSETQARMRRGWGAWLASWVGGGTPDAVLASFPLATALTPGTAAALEGAGPAYAALLDSGVCDERSLLMLLLVCLTHKLDEGSTCIRRR